MRVQEFIRPVIDEGLFDQNIFKAVFMAGSPGAGKSTIATKLLKHTGLKVVDVDRFEALHRGKGAEPNYPLYHKQATSQRGQYLQGRLGMIIDGTARRIDRMSAIKSELDELGYDTAMVFVNTNLREALRRADAREQITGRHVDPQLLKDYWRQTQANLGKLQQMFGNKFWLIDNSASQLPDLSWASKQVDSWLAKPVNTPAARAWQQQQLALRQR